MGLIAVYDDAVAWLHREQGFSTGQLCTAGYKVEQLEMLVPMSCKNRAGAVVLATVNVYGKIGRPWTTVLWQGRCKGQKNHFLIRQDCAKKIWDNAGIAIMYGI